MSLQHPEDILKHAISTFKEATKGLAHINVAASGSLMLVYLHSQYVPSYSERIIKIKFSNTIY